MVNRQTTIPVSKETRDLVKEAKEPSRTYDEFLKEYFNDD